MASLKEIVAIYYNPNATDRDIMRKLSYTMHDARLAVEASTASTEPSEPQRKRLEDLPSMTAFANLVRRSAYSILTSPEAGKDLEHIAGTIAVAVCMNHRVREAFAETFGEEDAVPSDVRAPKGGYERCPKIAANFVPRLGMTYACVLTASHNGPCQPGGTCFTHGPYIGEPGGAPVCPRCAPAEASRALGEQTDDALAEIQKRQAVASASGTWCPWEVGALVAKDVPWLVSEVRRLRTALSEAQAERATTLNFIAGALGLDADSSPEAIMMEAQGLRSRLSTKDAEIARLTGELAESEKRFDTAQTSILEQSIDRLRADANRTPSSEPDHAR